MLKNDYRLNVFSPHYEIGRKKKNLICSFRLSGHKRTVNHYSLVKKEFKKDFSKVYEQRCAYCGLMLGPASLGEFEIDHIIPSSAKDNKGSNNHLDNLAFACKMCNSSKSSYVCDPDYKDLLSPDGMLGEVFVRDDLYYLKISDEYINNRDVLLFFKKLKLDRPLRRVDYLLSSINEMVAYLKEEELFGLCNDAIVEKLESVQCRLQNERNKDINDLRE